MSKYLLDPTERHQDTHYLECPRCGHHSIVSHAEGKYACLRCNWQRDVVHGWDEMPSVYVFIAIAIILIILLTGA